MKGCLWSVVCPVAWNERGAVVCLLFVLVLLIASNGGLDGVSARQQQKNKTPRRCGTATISHFSSFIAPHAPSAGCVQVLLLRCGVYAAAELANMSHGPPPCRGPCSSCSRLTTSTNLLVFPVLIQCTLVGLFSSRHSLDIDQMLNHRARTAQHQLCSG
jgi:hypothetical protein